MGGGHFVREVEDHPELGEAFLESFGKGVIKGGADAVEKFNEDHF